MPHYPILHLRPGKDEPIERRHPWVFSGALDRRSLPSLHEGEIVDLHASDDRFLARGYWSPENIAVRILTFDEKEAVDGEEFWYGRLADALRLREQLGLTGEEASYRLIHGEGDGLPGLIIDLYGSLAVMQAHTLGIHLRRKLIDRALRSLLGETLQTIFYKSAETLTTATPIEGDPDELLLGNLPKSEVIIREGDLRLYLDVVRGQKTGFFLDQRDNRMLLRHYARGRRVLNMFCYTGGFSLAAMAGGADLVTSVDSSERAIDAARRNMELNFPEEESRHRELTEDAFAHLEQLERGSYDLIVLDPPAFAKSHRVLTHALNGYRRINRLALEKIAPSGLLFTFSCSQVVTPAKLQEAVFTAALQAGREVRILHRLTQAPDHPVSIYHPEGEYLKGLVLYVK